MKNFYLASLLTVATIQVSATTPATDIGVLNFAKCVTESIIGKKEQATLETANQQYASMLEDSGKQLNEISEKFQNKDIMDSLSPEATTELKEKWIQLNENYKRQAQEYEYALQQKRNVGLQTIAKNAQEAAKIIAQEKNLTLVINKDACFYYLPTLDITPEVIKKMDLPVEELNKNSTEPLPPKVE